MRGVNATERVIRQTAAMIRSKLGESVQRLDRGVSLNDPGEVQRMPAGPGRAVTLRQPLKKVAPGSGKNPRRKESDNKKIRREDKSRAIPRSLRKLSHQPGNASRAAALADGIKLN